jgi:hypothetical protein
MAEALGLPPERIPADPRWLRLKLMRIAPAALGVTPKSWSNTRSNVQAALQLFGITERRINRPADLSPAWSPLWTAVLATKDRSIKPILSRFVYFLNRLASRRRR